MSATNNSNHASPAPAKPTVEYLPIDPAAIEACATLGYESFARFSLSVGQPPEFTAVAIYRNAILAELDKPTTFHLMAVDTSADAAAPHYVDGVGAILGSVLMDCIDEAAAIGPISVASDTQSRGIGRRLMELTVAEAHKRGFTSVRLNNIVSNIAAFSLYHSLGFRARDYSVALKGHVSPDQHKALQQEAAAEGVSVRPMRRDDIAECDRLHVATTSFSRLHGTTHSFEAQLSQRRLGGDSKGSTKDEEGGDGYQQPDDCCLVAVDRDGRIVGYNDGYDVDSHFIAVRESIVVYLYSELSQRLQSLDPPMMVDIHVISQRHGALLDRLMRIGCRAQRQACIMVMGEYVPPHRYVYCPSIMW